MLRFATFPQTGGALIVNLQTCRSAMVPAFVLLPSDFMPGKYRIRRGPFQTFGWHISLDGWFPAAGNSANSGTTSFRYFSARGWESSSCLVLPRLRGASQLGPLRTRVSKVWGPMRCANWPWNVRNITGCPSKSFVAELEGCLKQPLNFCLTNHQATTSPTIPCKAHLSRAGGWVGAAFAVSAGLSRFCADDVYPPFPPEASFSKLPLQAHRLDGRLQSFSGRLMAHGERLERLESRGADPAGRAELQLSLRELVRHGL